MSVLSETVQLSIVADTIGLSGPSLNAGLIVSYNAPFSGTRTYEGALDVAADFATTSVEYRAATAYFSQSPHPQNLVIGKGISKPTMAYVITPGTIGAAGTVYSIQVDGESVTSTLVTYTSLADIVGTLLPRTTNVLTSTAHGMSTGDGPYRVSNSGGALPTGLTAATNYWIIKIDANTFSFASSLANALALTAVALSGDGTGTQTILRSENDVVMAQMLQGLNAVVGKNYTAVQSGSTGSELLTVTASAAGEWFSLGLLSTTLFNIVETYSDPGIATDLAAILLADQTWYCFLPTFRSSAMVAATAAWIEAESLICMVDVVDTAALNTAVDNGDTLDALHTLTYNRTCGSFNAAPADFMSAAWAGRVLSDEPGSATFKFKQLAGVAPSNLTATQRANLRARKANFYATMAGVNVTFDGTIAGGSYGFLDVTWGLDWLEANIEIAVAGALVASEKIPYTNAGLAIIRSELKSVLKQAVSMGIISEDFEITMPQLSSISDSNKAIRNLPGVKFSATQQGAIHTVDIEGIVSV